MDKLLRRAGLALLLAALAAGVGAFSQDPDPQEADAADEDVPKIPSGRA